MSYNGSGTFQINTTGQPVITGTVISSTAFNALTADLATGLSTAITKDGQTTTTARIPFAAGINSTLTTDSTNTTTGSILTAGGVGIAKALYVGTTANIAGVLSTTSPNITTSITTPSTSFDLINATATTLNLGGAATTFNVGAATGTMTVANTTLAAKAITASTTLGVTGAATLSSTLTYGGVTLTNAVTGTGKMVLDTSPTLVTPALGTPASGVLTNCTGVQYNGFKNRILNGSMVIDQRNAGASQTFTAAAALAYSVDRWYGYCTGANVTGQQVAGSTTPTNTQFRYRFTGAASVTAVGFGQRIEQKNSYDLAGSTCTLSADLAISATLTTVTWTAYYATTTADTFGTLASPTVTQIATGTFTVTSTVTNFSANISVPAAATTGIQIVFTVGALTAGLTWTIGNVQFEKGSTATSFDYRPYINELQLCQRYYEKSYPQSVIANGASGITDGATFIGIDTASATNNNPFKIVKRASPTINIYAPPGGSGAGSVRYNQGGTIVTGYSATDISEYGFNRITKTAGLTSTHSYSAHFTAESEL